MNSPRTLLRSSLQVSGLASGAVLSLALLDAFSSAALAQSTTGCGLDSWNASEALVTVWLRDVVYDTSGGFVAAGDSGVILTSPDGQRWLAHYQPLSIGFARVRHANGLYYAMGQQFGPLINTWGAVLWSSPDGLSWTPRYEAEDTVVTGLAAGSGKLVALANVSVPGGGTTANSLISVDGFQWTLGGTITDRRLCDIAYGNGVFVATGGNRILVSPDGMNWTAAVVPNGLALQAVAVYQRQFIAVGGGGVILTSSDGTTWTTRVSGTASFLSAVAPGNDDVAVAGDSGTVLTSQNGIDWAPRLSARLDIRGLTYGADRFVAVGRYGAIYQSGTLSGCGGPRLAITRGLPTRVGLAGTIGVHYRIESADHIAGPWTLLSDIASLPQSPYLVTDSTTSPTGQRFYRAIQP